MLFLKTAEYLKEMMKEDRNSELQTFVLKVQFPFFVKASLKGEVSWGLGWLSQTLWQRVTKSTLRLWILAAYIWEGAA